MAQSDGTEKNHNVREQLQSILHTTAQKHLGKFTSCMTIAELKEVRHVIWDNIPQGPIEKVVESSQSDWRPVLQLRVDISNTHSNCNVMTVTFA